MLLSPPHPNPLHQGGEGAGALPVAGVLPELLGVLERSRSAVLVAPPGAGKTTLVPPALLGAGGRGDGRIVVLEPRRLAARAAAGRMAALAGEGVGGTFGYRTRLDSAVSAATRVEVVTEGLLVRRLLSDPGLEGVAAVVLDEVHERALDADLALALLLDLQRVLRPELRLLAMSATPDTARLAALLDAPVVESAGRQHPVTVEHAARDIQDPRDLPAALARAVRATLAAHGGDILAFLPGMGEIRRAMAELEGCGALVLPLHGDLPPAEQDRALRPAEGRRVVLATSIAETSLTVPGVRVVVDGGWRRAPRLDPSTGLSRLATVRISRAAADQRAGRAGREAPGVALRLWTPALHRGLAPFDRPEILEAELSGLVLDCAAWGTAPSALPFPDPPPAGALAAGAALLRELGALDDAGVLTGAGRRMAELGAHPRLAAMMLAARDAGEAALAADLAALLEERDPVRAPARGADVPADVTLRLDLLAGGDAQGADRGAVSRIRRAAAQYRRRLHVPSKETSATIGYASGRPDAPLGGKVGTARQEHSQGPAGSGGTGARGGDGPEPAGGPGPLLAAGFPDRIAQRRGEPGSFRLSGGGGAKLPRTDPLANAPLLAVGSLDPSGGRIRLAAPLDPAALPASVAARAAETVESGLDPVSGRVLVRRRKRLGALVLEDRTSPADPADAALTLADALGAKLDLLPWTDAARQFQARAVLLRELDPDVPDLSDLALAASVREWLQPYLSGMTKLADAAGLDLAAALRTRLGWQHTARLDRELPAGIDLPHGRAAVDYLHPVPVASARAQAFYGLDRTPQLAGGRVPLRLALLSPAGRPIAVTADLPGFWRGAWADARRDMRGRYPKHDWPENPAEPTM